MGERGTSSLLKQAGLSLGGSAQTHQLLNQGESGAAVKINDLNTANSSQWRSAEGEEEEEGRGRGAGICKSVEGRERGRVQAEREALKTSMQMKRIW